MDKLAALVLMCCMGPATLALHLFTVLIAYERFGFLSALMAFALPVLAELYYVVKTISATGL